MTRYATVIAALERGRLWGLTPMGDYVRLAIVGAPTVSADGAHFAILVTSADMTTVRTVLTEFTPVALPDTDARPKFLISASNPNRRR